MLDLAEWQRTFEQLARERKALDESYADLMEAKPTRPEGLEDMSESERHVGIIRELIRLNERLGN